MTKVKVYRSQTAVKDPSLRLAHLTGVLRRAVRRAPSDRGLDRTVQLRRPATGRQSRRSLGEHEPAAPRERFTLLPADGPKHVDPRVQHTGASLGLACVLFLGAIWE